jgi:hypothetical protein
MVVYLPPQTVSGAFSYVLTRQYPLKVALYNVGTTNASVTFYQYTADTVTETVLANSTQVRDLSDIHTVSGSAIGTTMILEVVSGDEDIDPRYIGGSVTPPGTSFSIDSSLSATAGAKSSLAQVLSTSHANDVILVAIVTNSTTATVSSVGDTAGLSYAQRQAITDGSNDIELWWAPASSPLASDTITVNLNKNATFSVAIWAVNGSTTYTSPFDANSSLPATNTGSSTGPTSGAFSTNTPNDFVIAFMGCVGSPTVTVPGGYTLIQGASGPTNNVSYDVLSGTASGTTLTWVIGTSQQWGTIVDALAG